MSLLAALAKIPGGGLAPAEALEDALRDPVTLQRGTAEALMRPASTEAVSAIVKVCVAHDASITPRGGGSGFVAGAIPLAEGRNVILSLERINAIRAIAPEDESITLEAGVILAAAREAAAEHDLVLPIAHGGEGSAQIGGTLATNAGGNNVVKYGMARAHVLGLEVVLADGTVWNGLNTLRKDNAGPDLKHLFIGSEGTLGIITAAALRLSPAPASFTTALAAVPDPIAAHALYRAMRRRLGDLIAGFELMPRAALELHFARKPATRAPFDTAHDWLLLIELAHPAQGLPIDTLAQDALSDALEAGLALDVVIAQSPRERTALWSLREGLAEAQATSPRVLKSDTSVPVAQTPAFIEAATGMVEAAMPGAIPLTFGHLGDGNIHFNVLAPQAMATEDFLAQKIRLTAAIDAATLALGGSIAAEHGIGGIKRDALANMRTPEELSLLRTLKRALDPHDRLNPGKVLVD